MDQTFTHDEQQPAPSAADGDRRPAKSAVAPLVHTLVLIAVLLANSWLSAHTPHDMTGAHSRIFMYLRNIGWEFVVVLYVWLGTRRRISLRELVGGRWQSAGDVARDGMLGAGLWLAIMTLIALLASAMGMLGGDAARHISEARQRFGFLLPHSSGEVLLFLVMSSAAGMCEEIVFRGYLQRQFAALTGNAIAAIALQALLFGAAHGYQGAQRMTLIAAEGVLLGVVALERKSLRPGMVAHTMQDAISGLIGRHLR